MAVLSLDPGAGRHNVKIILQPAQGISYSTIHAIALSNTEAQLIRRHYD